MDYLFSLKNRPPEVIYEKSCLKNFAKFTEKRLRLFRDWNFNFYVFQSTGTQVFLKISRNLQESTCVGVCFLIKLQSLGFRLRHMCFPVNLRNFKKPFLPNISGGCFILLSMDKFCAGSKTPYISTSKRMRTSRKFRMLQLSLVNTVNLCIWRLEFQFLCSSKYRDTVCLHTSPLFSYI